jgi:hypothetical protein
VIKQKGEKWLLYTRDGSRVLGTHDTPEQARAQERAIMVSKHAEDEKQGGAITEMMPQLIRRLGSPSPMAEPLIGPTLESIKNLGSKLGITPALKAMKDRADRAIYEGLVHRKARMDLEQYLRSMPSATKNAGALGQLLSDVIDVPRPHPGIPEGQFPSMGTMSPYRAPSSAAIIAHLKTRRGKTAALADVLPHFLDTLDRIKS